MWGGGSPSRYETFGDPSRPTALLVMGLAVQMLGWPEDFCDQLADAGFHVVRFDNRDVGHSTHVPGAPPTARQLLTRSRRAAHYTLADMAEDAAGLLRELELAPAHVIGASMGGHDRPDAGRPPPGAGALAGVDHVHHREARPAASRRRDCTRCS